MRPVSIGRKIFTLLPLLCLIGSAILMFFLMLSGATKHSTVLSKFYWLKADTSNMGDYSTTKWTNYRLCNGETSGECGSSQPALPISPKDNFGSSSSLPSSFTSKRNQYYYESRIAWAFLAVALFLTLLAILLSLPALCLNSSVVLTLLTFVIFSAFALLITSAALYTNVCVMAKKAFKNNGSSASVGKKMMGFIWASVLLLLIASILSFLLGCCQFAANRADHHKNREKEYAAGGAAAGAGATYSDDDETFNNDQYDSTYGNQNNNRFAFWNRNRNNNNRNTTTGAGTAAAGGVAAGGVGAYEYDKHHNANNTAGTGTGGYTGTTDPAYNNTTTTGGAGNTTTTTTDQSPSKINFFRVRNNRENEATTGGNTGTTTTNPGYVSREEEAVYGRQRTNGIDV